MEVGSVVVWWIVGVVQAFHLAIGIAGSRRYFDSEVVKLEARGNGVVLEEVMRLRRGLLERLTWWLGVKAKDSVIFMISRVALSLDARLGMELG